MYKLSLESRDKLEKLSDFLGEIVTAPVHTSLLDEMSLYDVLTSFDSRGLLPRRWLLH